MAKSVSNPFFIGGNIPEDFFCDRDNETALLSHHMSNGRNVFLVSERRLGKTGLINHLFAQKDIASQFYTVFVDIYPTNSLREFVLRLGKAVFASVKPRGKTLVQNFFKKIASLRIGFKLDPTSGESSLDLSLGDIKDAPATLDEIFSFLNNAQRPCIVAIDEFQQIAAYDEKNVEALLRSHIQHCSNVRFIFAGSQRHLLSQMFSSPARPFYMSALSLELTPIPLDVYSDFARRLFSKFDKAIDPEAVASAYSLVNGSTWHLQSIMNELFAVTPPGATCSPSDLSPVLDRIVASQSIFYSEILAGLTARQRALLLAIASEPSGVNAPTSTEFISRHALSSASSVQTALRSLTDKGLVVSSDHTARIRDPFLSLYILSQL